MEPLLPWKSDNFAYSECVCSVSNAHEPGYIAVCPLGLYSIFPRYVISDTIFGQKVVELKMCVFIFSTTFVRNIYLSKNISARCHKGTNVVTQSTYYSTQTVMKLKFSR